MFIIYSKWGGTFDAPKYFRCWMHISKHPCTASIYVIHCSEIVCGNILWNWSRGVHNTQRINKIFIINTEFALSWLLSAAYTKRTYSGSFRFCRVLLFSEMNSFPCRLMFSLLSTQSVSGGNPTKSQSILKCAFVLSTS